MTGAPREFYAPQSFFIISLDAVKALNGSWEAAACWQRISWRSERDGYWRVSMQEIADEIGVSLRAAKSITKRLRDIGWVTAERENTWDATLTWRPVFEGEPAGRKGEGTGRPPESAASALSGGTVGALTEGAPAALSQGAPAALSSSKTEETSKTKEGAADASPDVVRDDVERVCTHLADRIEQNGSKRPLIGKTWRDAARLAMDVDKHSERQMHNMIDWCQSNEFWRAHVMSMSKLRDKYDAMRLQAERDAGVRAIGNRHMTSDPAERQRMIDALNG